MNITDIEAKILPYLKELAAAPEIQADLEGVTAAIIAIIENAVAKERPWLYQIFTRFIRWITLKIKGDVKIMNGIATIIVKDRTGTALSGTVISYKVGATTVDNSVTDATGQLTISGLPAGTYTFRASHSGYIDGSVDLTVLDDVTATGAIVLTISVARIMALLLAELETVVDGAADEAVNDLIAGLKAEIATGSSIWVDQFRDPIEILGLNAIKNFIISKLDAKLEAALKTLLANYSTTEKAMIENVK